MIDFEYYKEKNRFMTHSFIEPVSVDEMGSVMKVELRDEIMNLNGYVHGGLFMTMADCAAGIAARADGRNYVTQSAHVNFIGNLKEGTIYAKASVVKRGKRVVIIRVSVVDENDRLLMDGTYDMFCVL